jgi:hypothetical protein
MCLPFVIAITAAALLASAPVRADDGVAKCKEFFAKFDQCVERLEGEKQEDARIFVRTLKATLGLSDDLNQGNPLYLSIMCSATMEEAKKDPEVQSYNCDW